MKRIALICDHASPRAALGGAGCGGRNEYVRQVAQGLAASGCLIDVFTRRTSPSEDEVEPWTAQVRIVHVPAGPPARVAPEELLAHMPEFTRFTLDFMRHNEGGYHVMHAHFFLSALVAADVRQATGIPFVVTLHELGRVRRQHLGSADRFPSARIDIEDRVVREADAVIAQSPQDRDDLLTMYGATRSRTRLIPCGVDAERFRPVPRARARAALGIPADDFVILHVGRLTPESGADDIIRVVAWLRHQLDVEARLLLVGGESDDADEAATPEIARLRRLAERELVDDLVRFVGRRCGEILRFYYSAADVAATMPSFEPFGMVPLESMACATPVIGTAVGGIKYSVIDGETGFLVAAHDTAAAADRIRRLHADPSLRAALGRSARDRAVRAFSWFDVVRSIAGLYDDVAETEPGRRPNAAVRLAREQTPGDALGATDARSGA